MAVIMLSVEGTPRPQPRPRLARGRVVSTADANAARWKATIQEAAKVALEGHGPLAGPLAVGMEFTFATPKHDRHDKPHTHVPDADNLAKLALDAVVKAGLVKDDSAVSCLVVRKTWAKDAGMVMTLSEDKRVVLPEPPVDDHPRWVN
jgi:Holliday junction resolvase RusA-like endonuclease